MRIHNQAASNNIRHMEGRVKTANTVPFDIELLALLNFMSEKQVVEHINNLLSVNIEIVEEEKGDK